MVKKIIAVIAFFSLSLITILTGCNQAPAPVAPRDGASLSFSFPIPPKPTPSANKQSSLKKDAVGLTYGTLWYRVTSGGEVITGGINYSYSYQYTIGTVSIPLTHNGTWLVSAEWLDYGSSPRFVGADQVNVQGTTSFTLRMGDVTLYGCSYNYFADPGNCNSAYYGDLFTFDTAMVAYSVNAGTGDIQFKYDSNTGSEYITTPNGTTPAFAYLGTGLWVNFTDIPAGTVYYPDTETAKTAVLGAGNGTMEADDVYVVQLSPTYHAWMQIPYTPSFCTAGDQTDIHFRINSNGYPFMKYDATTYDKTNCVGLTYYPGGG